MRPLLFIVFCLFTRLAIAAPAIEQLLAQEVAPTGVVFEIVEEDEDGLRWALPRVTALSERLRARFPGLPLAVVTHGREQFGLLAREAGGALAPIHVEARELRASDIDLHVCGTHAGWYGHPPEDFPAYVDVSPSGPAQIRDYINLGYSLIRVRRADD